jgi:transcriptional regulator with XRE-family HTH domain
MSKKVNDIINKLSPAQRGKVEARAAELIAEEMTLQQLRRARKLTQERMAKSLHIGQEGVSKIEKRSDLLISTLRGYVEAMGGSLSIIAEFPDRQPVMLSGIAAIDTKPTSNKRQDAWGQKRRLVTMNLTKEILSARAPCRLDHKSS